MKNDGGGINPNQDVGASEIEVSSGGAVSFDEMMELDNASSNQESSKEAAPEKADAKSEVESENDKKLAEDKNVDTTPGAGKSALKLLKAKNGDQPLDVPADAVFDVMIDGKKEAVSAQDLLNNYSGKTDWTRKYTDFDKERKSYQTERQVLEKNIEGFLGIVNKPEASFTDIAMTLAQFAQVDNPISFVRALRQKLTPDAQKWLEMSEQDRMLAETKEENQFLTAKEQSKRDAEVREQEIAQLQQKIDSVREAAKISEEDFKSTYRQIVQDGKVPEESITPEYVAEYYQVSKAYDLAEKVLESVDPESKDDAQALRQLVSIKQDNPDFSEDDLRDVAEAMLGRKAKRAAKALSDKVRSNEPKAKASSSAPRAPQNEPINFDDLE